MTAAPVLSLRGVNVLYPGAVPVHALRDVDIDVMPGEFLAIVGPSGCGKSTLMNVMGLLEVPTSGECLLGDTAIGASDRERSRRRNESIGFVFQAFHLLPHRTALENVELPLVLRRMTAAQRRAIALDKLREVGLESRAEALARVLSGGEKQRVAIARALASDAPLLLCDEPTGNLDSHAADVIVGLLRRQQDAGGTLVMVTHDESIALQADRIVRMRDGQIV